MSDQPQSRPRRPWYLTLALYAACVIAASTMTASCNDLDFLRGSQVLPDVINKTLEQPSSELVRTGMLREKARLEATAQHHHITFPISLAQLLVSVVLLAAAGACLMRRSGSRKFALQALAVNALLATIAFSVLGPVREAIAETLAAEAVNSEAPAKTELEREHSFEEYKHSFIWLDGFRFVVFELGVFAAIAYALTRRNSRSFLDEAGDQTRQPSDEGGA